MVGWFLNCFVSATLQVALGKLGDFGTFAYTSISDVDDKLEKLRKTLTSAQSMMNDKQRAKAWEDLAYEASDLIDEIEIAVSKLEGTGQANLNLVNKFLLSLSRRTSGPNMNDMQAQLNDLLNTIHKHSESETQSQRACFDTNRLRIMLQTTSLVDESHVFGRESDKEEIISMLVAWVANNVSVFPIVGMIGVGKTTLAQFVYNSEYADHFQLKMWVSVTKDFDIVRITRSIIEASKCGNSHHLDLELLQLELKKILRDKKFLLVLDDLWNENPDELDLLFKPLKHGLEGSKIIVTTRSYHVVSSLEGATPPYHLKCLTDEDCWLLLKDRAFGSIQVVINPKLEAIGRKIARKCKGFPLAAKSIGRLLSRKHDEFAWNDVLETQIWSVHNEAVGALRSNFCDHLPSHLKDCFAYCSIFPQGYGFERDKLVRMWMGEGFILPCEEDLGTECFDKLFGMTIFEFEAEKYKMHEAVHDLARVVCGDKFFRMEEAYTSRVNANTRYLSLVCDKIHIKTFEACCESKGLRTFVLFSNSGTVFKEVPYSLFLKLARLRVLDLSISQLEELAKSIGSLKHLRFLDLSNTRLRLLPDEVQELALLQTLRLVNCLELFYLPEGISKLKGLQHLELGSDSRLTSMPSGIGKLTAIRTLSEFIVGPKSGQMKELKDMNNIRGSLCIKQLENVSKPEEAVDANLANKYIEELELQWTFVVDAGKDEHVLGNLMTGPHKSLKRLTLRRYAGRMLPGWVSDRASKLTSIFLKDCKNCEVLPPLGQLPNLRSLKVEGMHELISVDEDFQGGVAGFQALETLEFRSMPKLERWVGICDKDMECLRELTIAECPHLFVLPSLHYLQSLERLEFEMCPQLPSFPMEGLSSSIKYLTITECPILKERCRVDGGEDWMLIEHIPYIEIDYEDVRESDP